MSIKSWKEEFYPIPASRVRKKDAIDHSIKKWEGLSPENLSKHELTYNFHTIMSCNEDYFCLGGNSCALCTRYCTADLYCEKCPLYKINGDVRCDHINKDNINLYGDPDTDSFDYLPMYNMLLKLKKI